MAILQQPRTAEQPDVEFMYSIGEGSRAAFSQLYRLHAKDLYRYGYHLVHDKSVVEDAIHDVFVSIWTNKDHLRDVQSMKAYLMVCVRNGILKKLTSEKKLLVHHTEWIEETYRRGKDEESHEQERNMVKQIRDVINMLSDKQREVIYLRFYQNLSYNEIATLLNTDQRNAYNLASKAYAFIKDHLRK